MVANQLSSFARFELIETKYPSDWLAINISRATGRSLRNADFLPRFSIGIFSPPLHDSIRFPAKSASRAEDRPMISCMAVCKRIFREFDRDIYGVHARLRVLRRSYARAGLYTLACLRRTNTGGGEAPRIEYFVKLTSFIKPSLARITL